jgi:hypothetical protein
VTRSSPPTRMPSSPSSIPSPKASPVGTSIKPRAAPRRSIPGGAVRMDGAPPSVKRPPAPASRSIFPPNHAARRRRHVLPVVECSAAPIRNDGAIIGTVLVFRDITERRQAEENWPGARTVFAPFSRLSRSASNCGRSGHDS